MPLLVLTNPLLVVLILSCFKNIIDPSSSFGKICLGKDIVEISSGEIEGFGEWDSPEYEDTTISKKKTESETLVFYKIDTEKDSDRYVAQCFVNGLYVPDGEINLEKNDNLISNDYAVKLCIEYEGRKGKKVVKKELMVSLNGEIYFVQFVINPEEDEFEQGLIFGRSFLRSANAIANFGEGTITIQPDFDPFLERSDDERKESLKGRDEWDEILDFDFDLDDLPPIFEEEPCNFMCKMGKSNRIKKKIMDKIDYFYQNIGTSSSTNRHMTQEEAEEEALMIKISQNYALLEEKRPVIETLNHQDKYKKLIDEIWTDKVKLE